MKALVSDLFVRVKTDLKGKEALKNFIATGVDEQEIELSDGTKYKISNKKPPSKSTG